MVLANRPCIPIRNLHIGFDAAAGSTAVTDVDMHGLNCVTILLHVILLVYIGGQ